MDQNVFAVAAAQRVAAEEAEFKQALLKKIDALSEKIDALEKKLDAPKAKSIKE